MQASREWSPPSGTLGRILDDTRRRLATIEKPRVSARGSHRGNAPSLREALSGDDVAVIAEIKRRSPSKGALNENVDPAAQAQQFAFGGARAISVLTEPTFFGGSGADLEAVRLAVPLPVLRKDFHLEVTQMDQAATEGASAVLLIARALAPDELPQLMQAARERSLEVLVEVRSEWELERALECGAEIIGVNSRNLETLEVDDAVPARLLPTIPPGVLAVWESGIAGPGDVRRAAALGADAVLVGSALSVAEDAEAMVRALTGVERRGRHG